MTWDPGQYRLFSEERGRPFADLVARVRTRDPGLVVDLGCGPGDLTLTLAERWHGARVVGIDASPQMVAEARAHGGRVEFREGDVRAWSDPRADVIVSNACMHWLPDHRDLMAAWAAALPAGGAIAVQMPRNDSETAHVVMRDLATSPRWRSRLKDVPRPADTVAVPDVYVSLLIRAGVMPDVWETVYMHTLTGEDPVLEWLRGTALRPVIAALGADELPQFEKELRDALREAYPVRDGVVVLPYRRIFVVGHAPAS